VLVTLGRTAAVSALIGHDGGLMPGYRELPPPDGLNAHIACLWTSHDRAVRVLPDACVDIVLDAGRLVVAGPATTAMIAPATPGQERCGVRFRIASAGAALGVPVGELLDSGVPLAELWGQGGHRLEAVVAAAPSTDHALAALVRGVAERLPAAGGDLPIRQAALALVRGCSVGEASRLVGLSERQLRRRFEGAVGYGPATLVRIQRFQRFLAIADARPRSTIADLAVEAGYADQAHLSRECRRLSGLPTSVLLADGPAPAGEKSDSFKPGSADSARLAA
jgi:AraC-like DNA-binding protein